MKIRGKIPITIHPGFWILAALIAILLGQGNILSMLVWVFVIFFSVLFHEFGHALTALAFGRNPRIELVAMGGLTYHDGDKLPFWKQFLITLNGPVFGFVIVVIAYFLRDIPALKAGYAGQLMNQILLVNLIWTVVNLVPILPLDGGQLLRIGLEKFFAFKGVRYAFMASAVLALLFSLFLFVTQNFLAGAIFFLFAFENFENFRKSRYVRETDRREDLKKALIDSEMILRQGNKEEALQAFQKIREQTKEGLIYDTATQYVAFLLYDQGKKDEAYPLLLSVKDRLAPDGLALLHRLAFEQGNYPLVLELAGPVFQYVPEAEVALRSAYAAASLNQAEPSVGWLQTAQQSGVDNLKEIIQEKVFDPIRNDPFFAEFTASLN